MLGLARCLSKRSALRLLWFITWLGIALAVTGIVQRPLYSESIYGFWKPLTTGGHPFGPFVNKNHFAGWIVMALPLVLGYFCAIVSRGTQTVRPTLRALDGRSGCRRGGEPGDPRRACRELMGFALVLMPVAVGNAQPRVGAASRGSAAVRHQQGRWAARPSLAALLFCRPSSSSGPARNDRGAIRRRRHCDLGSRLPIWQGGVASCRTSG